MTPIKRKEVARLLARAAVLQAKRWDAERDIEMVIGRELNHSESFIKHIAFSIDSPKYEVKVSRADVDALLKDNEW